MKVVKIISFNANGIRSAARKGFYEWLQQQNADVVCIQETKAQIAQLMSETVYFPQDYHCDYFDAVKKAIVVLLFMLEKSHYKSLRA
ncbi:exonuclease III [Legionella oakridgensis ATCC 33761 = DSM 21215]|uniref:Exonuclease III n=1 Tax=Legionella oakridgensis ATCC 33761 = DSM 21215 TaxID=1268635 RepID=W0BHU9_9GAMM|nr:exonuclease III [Legionella oakridgensis ATCC 33761 = DSM 21215]